MKTTSISDSRFQLLEVLEEWGFAMVNNPLESEYLTEMPQNLRMVEADPRTFRRSYHGPPLGFVGPSGFAWDSYVQVPIGSDAARECLWQYLEVGSDAKAILEFTATWGLFNGPGRPEVAGLWSIDYFVACATEARNFLVALVATEAGEEVPEAVLDGLYRAEGLSAADQVWNSILGRMEFPTGEARDALFKQRRESRLSAWRQARRNGTGLALQRDVLAKFLDERHSPSTGWVIWDEDGRRVFRQSSGVENIVWDQLYALFMSPSIDVFICGNCGRLFPFDESQRLRRPRNGSRALCSEECRKAAKRRANRLSWEKNKKKWRPSVSSSEGT